jgi:hypothetical protein
MSAWLYDFRIRRDRVTIPTIWVAFALSVLIHVLLLGKWLPQVRLPSIEEQLVNLESSRSLVVNLAPPSGEPPAPPPSPALEAAPGPTHRAARPKAPPHRQPSPPVLALNRPTPESPRPKPEIAPPAVAPAPPRPAGDLSSYIETQRRARGEPAPSSAPSAPPAPAPNAPLEDEDARSKRAIAANLGLNRAPTYGPEPAPGGGIFQLKHVAYDYAEFYFYGWNRDIRRNTTQLIEVRKGNNADIRIAVVRKMIAIIREYEADEFLWESQRLGRNVRLSARQRDNAGLEDFMMDEFFPGARLTQ